jgi:lysophospholipase L1-like esterase
MQVIRMAKMRRGTAALLAMLTGACGGGTDIDGTAGGTPASGIAVDVAPASPTVPATAVQPFAASVTGTVDSRVIWTIREGSPVGGAVTASGGYTAPSTAGTFHVVATSVADPTKSAAATVTVVASPPTLAGAPVVYSGDRTQSPMDDTIVRRLKDIAARGTGLDPHNFIKVGDSITASNGFLTCFDGGGDGIPNYSGNGNMGIYLGERAYLAPAVVYFRANLVAGTTLFGRTSIAAQSGADASFPLGASRLQQEVDAVHPQYAVVMYGSNDVARPDGQGNLATNIVPYEANMRALVDALIARGVIPILSTIPPRQDSPAFLPLVPAFNGVVRAIAQGRQVPLIDLNRELMALPVPRGISSDGIHPILQDWNTGCWFRDALGDLTAGYNVRNLLTVEALGRMKGVMVDSAAAPDASAVHLAGSGTTSAPYQILSLPFADMRDSRGSTQSSFASYSCSGAPAAPGAEAVYQLVLAARTAVRIVVLDAGANAVNVSLLAQPAPGNCLKSGSRFLGATLDAGTYYVVVDGLAAGGGAEYTLSVTECVAGDTTCAN